jgi:hypothetical protein
MVKHARDNDEVNIHSDIGYLMAKLEIIHSDVKDLNKAVALLQQESTAKKAVNRFIVTAVGILGATVGWLVDNVLVMMHR